MSSPKRNLHRPSSTKVQALFDDTPRSPLPTTVPFSHSKESTNDSVDRRVRGALNPKSSPVVLPQSIGTSRSGRSNGSGGDRRRQETEKISNLQEVSSMKRSKGSLNDLSQGNLSQNDQLGKSSSKMRKVHSERDLSSKLVDNYDIRSGLKNMTHKDHQDYIDRMMKSISIDTGFAKNDGSFNRLSDSENSWGESWAKPSFESTKNQGDPNSVQQDPQRSSKSAEKQESSPKIIFNNVQSETKRLRSPSRSEKKEVPLIKKNASVTTGSNDYRSGQQDNRGRLPPSGSSKNMMKDRSERNLFSSSGSNDHRHKKTLPGNDNSGLPMEKSKSERNLFSLHEESSHDYNHMRDNNRQEKRSNSNSSTSMRKSKSERNLESLGEAKDSDRTRNYDRRERPSKSGSSSTLKKENSEQKFIQTSAVSNHQDRDWAQTDDGSRHDKRSQSGWSKSMRKVQSERNLFSLSGEGGRHDFDATKYSNPRDRRHQSASSTSRNQNQVERGALASSHTSKGRANEAGRSSDYNKYDERSRYSSSSPRNAQSDRYSSSSSDGRDRRRDSDRNSTTGNNNTEKRAQSSSLTLVKKAGSERDLISLSEHHINYEKYSISQKRDQRHERYLSSSSGEKNKRSKQTWSSVSESSDDFAQNYSSSRQARQRSSSLESRKNRSTSNNSRERRSSSRDRRRRDKYESTSSNRTQANALEQVEHLKTSRSSQRQSDAKSPSSIVSSKQIRHKNSDISQTGMSPTSRSPKRKSNSKSPHSGRSSPWSMRQTSRSSSLDRRYTGSKSASSPRRKLSTLSRESSFPTELPLTHIEISSEGAASPRKSERNTTRSPTSLESTEQRRSGRYSRQRSSSSNASDRDRRRSRSSGKSSSKGDSRQEKRDWKSLREMASTSKLSCDDMSESTPLQSTSWHGTGRSRPRRAGKKSELLGSSFGSSLDADKDFENAKKAEKKRTSSRSQDRTRKSELDSRRRVSDDTDAGGGVSKRRHQVMDKAAVVVQKWGRRLLAQKQKYRLIQEANQHAIRLKAALIVQETVRPFKLFLSRLKNDSVYQENASKAAYPIQRLIRSYQAKTKLERLRDEKHRRHARCSIHIQRIVRGYLAKLTREREKARRKYEWQQELERYKPEKEKYIEYLGEKRLRQTLLVQEISHVEALINKVQDDHSKEREKMELSMEVQKKVWGDVIRKRVEQEQARKQIEMQSQAQAENDNLDPNLSPEQQIAELEEEISAMKDWLVNMEPKVVTKIKEGKDLEKANLEVEKLFNELNEFAKGKVAEKKDLSSQQLMLTKMLIPKAAKHAEAATLEIKKEIRSKLVLRRNMYKVLDRLGASDSYDHDLYEEVKNAIYQCELELGKNFLESDKMQELVLGDVDALFEIEAIGLHELGDVQSVPASVTGWGMLTKGILSNLGKKAKFSLDDLSQDSGP